MKVLWEERAWADYLYWQMQDRKTLKRINELAIEKGIREKVIIAAGGTQVSPEDARATGIDEGFGRDSHGIDVATFLCEEAMRRRGELPEGGHLKGIDEE